MATWMDVVVKMERNGQMGDHTLKVKSLEHADGLDVMVEGREIKDGI